VFLFDEPLSNLDASLRVEMRLEIARLHQRLGATMIYVTHDQVEAMTLADKIVVMRDGVVEQVGQPLEIYHHPKSLFVAEFIGSPKMNTMPVEVTGVGSDGIDVRLPQDATVPVPVHAGDARVGQTLTLGIRPEHLRVDPDGAIAAGVSVVERLGDETYLHLDTPDGRQLVIQSDGEDETEAGDSIHLSVDGRFCHLFDAEGRALEPLERHRLAGGTRTGRKVR
jgi:multiple sugar transport system ATP-binding protein